jgi:hypothetical protein
MPADPRISPDTKTDTESAVPRHAWLGLVFCCLVYLACALPRLFQLAGLDEILYAMRLGNDLYRDEYRHGANLIAYSPHLHGLTIWLAHRAFGPGEVVARVPGMLAWVGAFALAWRWLQLREQSWKWSAVIALGATMPLAVQGGAIADIDNGFLVPLVFLQCWAIDVFVERRDWRGWLGVVLATTLALWGRLTTPTILLPVFVGYAWVRGTRRVAVLTGAAGGVGWLVFLASWGGYCAATGVPFADPFVYLRDSLLFSTVGSRGASLRKVVFTGVYLWLWLGGGVLVLFAGATVQRVREWWRFRQWQREDLFLGAGLFLLIGYSVVGGTLFGFPKYHCPAIPLLLVGCSPILGRSCDARCRAAILWATGLALVACAAQILAIGDPIRLLRLDLRHAMVTPSMPVRPILVQVAFRLGVGVLLVALPLVVAWAGRMRLVPLLVAVALGMNAGLLVCQGLGGYQTGYNYGDAGDTREVAAWLRPRLAPDSLAMVPGEVAYLLHHRGVPYLEDDQWKGVENIVRALRLPRMKAAGISILTNDAEQYRTLTANPEIRAVLDRDYTEHHLGAYVLFLRKERTE